jgi:hypothetical protein
MVNMKKRNTDSATETEESNVVAEAEASVIPVSVPKGVEDNTQGQGGCYVIGEDGIRRKVE